LGAKTANLQSNYQSIYIRIRNYDRKADVTRNDFQRQFAPQQSAKPIKSRATHLHCELSLKIIPCNIGLKRRQDFPIVTIQLQIISNNQKTCHSTAETLKKLRLYTRSNQRTMTDSLFSGLDIL
jgi:hypothetical protein